MRVLVIGETCEDKFVYGIVDRMCPEAPVPVFKPIETKTNEGMCGNVVNNFKLLSTDIVVDKWNQNTKITKTRYVEKNSNQMIVRVDDGEIEKVDRIVLNDRYPIEQYDAVVISDYDKGFLTKDDIKNIIKKSKFTVLDSKKILDSEILKTIDYVKLNYVEYMNNKNIVDENLDKVLITKGSRGVDFNGVNYPSPKPQDTIDVSGAGDTFVASFVTHYLNSKNVDKSIKFANEVCSDVVNKKGVTLPDIKYRDIGLHLN